ncbi:alpha/beta fold hydrolase [Candidatus Enterococcus ikei]|uniref:Alpha/beta fold hydrolase n=1 Tax=Candidatus Enterococcus ikei TaxID=2815326 RepID=A0ABS3GZ80_9ENTE|nr:alpha/beta fold hydrolase [Enterococcus sp. DIV0869a]MBO0440557.1 alpha/beta fold hydrolase [Enterococcus sp. DIV0869a]
MKKKKYYLLAMICVLLFFAGCTNKKISDNEHQQAAKNSTATETIQKSSIPTLFIHGYSGGNNSFGRMIKRMEGNDHTKKELVLTVSVDGKVQAKGKLTGIKSNPSVQVLFEDNKNNEWNQAEWIKNCLTYIQENYGVTEVNLVGHSMGGASSLRYLTTFGDDTSLPKINKFVGIAAPFNNFVELSNGETIDDVINNGPAVQSERYVDYVNGIEKVSKDIKVMIIAGDVEDGSLSDEAVPVADALSAVSLFKTHGNEVQEKIFFGKSAQHSQLHENKEVDQLVADFLWK